MRFCLSLAVLGAGFATASVAHAAGSLVPNADFDTGLEGWTQLGTGTASFDGSVGIPTPGSAHLVPDSAGGMGLVSACIEVDNSVSMDLRVNAFGGAGYVSAGVNAFSDSGCTTALSTIGTPALPVLNMELNLFDFALPARTHSANLSLSAFSISGGTLADAHFDHVEFGPTGTLFGSGISITQQGLSGAWYNPLTSGQGFEVVISQDRVFLNESALFGAWFTFDTTAGSTDSQRWYSFQTSRIEANLTSASVSIYQNVGGNFDAPPMTSATPVGQGTLRFETCDSGFFAYAFDDGRSGTIPLTRLLPNVTCDESSAPTDPPSDFGLTGAWYDPSTSGQGFIVHVDPVDTQVFIGWYTYALDGETLGPSGQRWFSAQAAYTPGATTMDLMLYTSTGGTFDSGDPAVTTDPVGTATIVFTNCFAATFTYEFTSGEFSGTSGTISLTRLETPLTSCDLP